MITQNVRAENLKFEYKKERADEVFGGEDSLVFPAGNIYFLWAKETPDG